MMPKNLWKKMALTNGTMVIQMKKLLDAGVISQEEFDKVKSDLLGL